MAVINGNNLNLQAKNISNSLKCSPSHSTNYSNQTNVKESKSSNPNLIETIEQLDAKITELGEQSQKTQKGAFAKCYNLFSKKDDKIEQELQQLKDSRSTAFKDGSLNKEELKSINSQAQESEKSLSEYKEGKKKAADTTATVGCIAAGVAVGVATGGAGLLVAAGASAAVSSASYVGIKEGCLGDEYKALGKEGLKDGLVAAAYGASGGALSVAGKAAAPAIANGASKIGMAVTEKVAENTIRYSSKVLVDEGLTATSMVTNGEKFTFTDAAVTAGASLLFNKTSDALASKAILKKVGGEIFEKTTKHSANTLVENKTKSIFGV